MPATPQPLSTEKLPLTEEEKTLLKNIFQTRSRFFVSAIAGLLLCACLASIRGSDRQRHINGRRAHDKSGDYILSSGQTFLLGITLLGGTYQFLLLLCTVSG